MILEILNEAKKKLDVPIVKKKIAKKAVKKTPKKVVPKTKMSNIPDKLGESFGEEITKNLKQYIEGRIEKGLYNDTIIGKIPDNVIFFVFDTETTGLNMTHDDVITEIACLAYDKEFNKIDEYHATVQLPEEKNPQIFIDRTYNSLHKIGLAKEEFDKILSDIEQHLGDEKVKDYGESELTHNLMMMIFNKIKGHFNKKAEFNGENYSDEDKVLLKQIYGIIKPLMRGENIKSILKMTKYGQIKAGTHEPDESSMVHNFLNFIHKVTAVKKGTPVLVAHNFPYDYKMVRQAFTRANKVYEDMKFIDTAQITRYYAYRYSYLLYLYNKKKFEKTQDGKYLQDVFKFHPTGNARMGTLAQHYRIPNLNWHTAKNDVEATAQILKYLFAIDSYYKDYMNKKMGADEHFGEIKNELDAENDRQRFSIDRDTGDAKEVDWFSPLQNRYMSAHQEDFANFTESIRDTKIYLEHFKDVSNKYYQKLDDFITKNSQKYGAASPVRRNFNTLGFELNNTYNKIIDIKSSKKKLEFIDETAALMMKTLKQTGIGPKDYIYYGKEIGVNYKKYILMNYIGEFASIIDDAEVTEELRDIRSVLARTNKETQITAVKRRLDNIFKDNPEYRNSKEHENYINDIGASEKHFDDLISNIISNNKEIHREFNNVIAPLIDEDELKDFEKFIKNMNKKKADSSTRFDGPLYDKYKNYNINNDYIREIIGGY